MVQVLASFAPNGSHAQIGEDAQAIERSECVPRLVSLLAETEDAMLQQTIVLLLRRLTAYPHLTVQMAEGMRVTRAAPWATVLLCADWVLVAHRGAFCSRTSGSACVRVLGGESSGCE